MIKMIYLTLIILCFLIVVLGSYYIVSNGESEIIDERLPNSIEMLDSTTGHLAMLFFIHEKNIISYEKGVNDGR